MLQWLVGLWRFSGWIQYDVLYVVVVVGAQGQESSVSKQWATILRCTQATAHCPWWEDASAGHLRNATTLTSPSALKFYLPNVDAHNIRGGVYILPPVISIQVLNSPSDFSQC